VDEYDLSEEEKKELLEDTGMSFEVWILRHMWHALKRFNRNFDDELIDEDN
jgi:hypothetical protein